MSCCSQYAVSPDGWAFSFLYLQIFERVHLATQKAMFARRDLAPKAFWMVFSREDGLY